MDGGAWQAAVHRVTEELEMTEVTENAHIYVYFYLSIHLYIPESLCCTPEANIILLINYSSKKESSGGSQRIQSNTAGYEPHNPGPWERFRVSENIVFKVKSTRHLHAVVVDVSEV